MTGTAEGVFHYEPWEGDLMDRHVTASTLQNYLDGNDDVRVLNINAPWGTGKTWFIKRWHDEMQKTRPTVYFNAWKNDHINDPFIAVVSAITEQAKSQMNTSEKINEAVKQLGRKAGSALISAAPALLNTIIKHKLGVDIEKFIEGANAEAIGEATEHAVEALISSNKQALEEVENFRAELARLAKALSIDVAEQTGSPEAPLYIFIDELDRCRPTYSIELLERIKHFFDVDNCKFVIASDTGQLCHSIGVVYGAGFESRRYLYRFFDSEYGLENQDIESLVIAELDWGSDELSRLGVRRGTHDSNGMFFGDEIIKLRSGDLIPINDDVKEYHIMVLALAQWFSLDLRTLKQCLSRVRFVYLNHSHGEFHIFWAFFLVVVSKLHPDSYKDFKASGVLAGLPKTEGSFYFGVFRVSFLELAGFYYRAMNDPRVFLSTMSSGNNRAKGRLAEKVVGEDSGLKKYFDLVELSYSLNA
ncbi:MAG: KAP family P-loop NTPase fold protein [Halothiobacillaceae bacterium]